MFEDITRISDNIGNNRNYYFIRTSKGVNFNSFLNGGFIGVNWNYITTQDLRDKTELEIKAKIARLEPNNRGGVGYDIATREGKQKVTSIYNKIIRFKELNKGDIVVIPSSGSEFLAFGYIDDDGIYNEFEDNTCDWHKRRRVNWITTERLSDLDSMFYKIVYAKHAISRLNDYSNYIDKVLSSAFVKDNVSHLVLNVRGNHEIDDDALINLMSNIKELTSLLNNDLNLHDLNQSSIRLNVQSPGTIEFLYRQSKSLLLAALMLAAPLVVSCSHTQGENAQNGSPQEIRDERDRNLVVMRDTIMQSNLDNNEKNALIDTTVVHYDTIANTRKNLDQLGARVERLNQIE